jgi:hypothetical protein
MDAEKRTLPADTVFVTPSEFMCNVRNAVETGMTFTQDKILTQNDHFNFYLWACPALGLPRSLFGWTTWFQRAVQS